MILFFAFVSCQKDENWKTEHLAGYLQEKEGVTSTMDFEEFSQQPGAEKVIHKLEQLQKSFSDGLFRGNGEDEFNIDSTRINQVRLDGKTSYTFLIYRDTLSTEYFENLLVSTDNETKEQHTFIYRYYNETHPEFSGIITETFNPQDQDNTSSIFSYLDCEWVEEIVTVEIPCTCGPKHYPGQKCACAKLGGDGPRTEMTPVWQYVCTRVGYSDVPSWYDWTDGPINPHGPGGDIDMPDVYTLPVPNSYLINLFNCLGLEPDSGEGKWLLENFLEMRKLSTFLTDNDCSEETQAFGEQAAIALANDGEVDFEERVIYDASFLNTNIECIHNQIKTSNTFYGKMIEHFNNPNQNSHLIYEIGNVPAGNWAITRGDPDNSNEFRIIVGNLVENKSNLLKMLSLSHELIHAYMFDFLEDEGIIEFDNNGQPILNITCSDGTNYSNINLNNLNEKDRFVALLCAIVQADPTNQNWTHELFNSPTFAITDYRTALEQLILNEHDWNNENPALVIILQNEFGNDWKEKTAEYLSWHGLEKTQAFENWAAANNVDYTINSDGTIGGAFNAIISTIGGSGNANCS